MNQVEAQQGGSGTAAPCTTEHPSVAQVHSRGPPFPPSSVRLQSPGLADLSQFRTCYVIIRACAKHAFRSGGLKICEYLRPFLLQTVRDELLAKELVSGVLWPGSERDSVGEERDGTLALGSGSCRLSISCAHKTSREAWRVETRGPWCGQGNLLGAGGRLERGLWRRISFGM